MKSALKKTLLALGAVATLAGAAGAASAGTFDQTHPRRAEVNARLDNQSHRIVEARRDGAIGPVRAHMLRVQDRRIRQEERFYARHQGGHLTKMQQRKLNREENRVSREIRG